MDAVLKSLLEQVSDLHDIPTGAYNIRSNGHSEGRNSTQTIQIKGKTVAISILFNSPPERLALTSLSI